MKTRLKCHSIKKHFKNTRGSVTLEATIIIPVIIILLFSMISLALFIYYKFVLMNAGVYAVEQSAFTWNNSLKKLETGAVHETAESDARGSDGLYWRVFNDFSDSLLVVEKKDKALVFFENRLGKTVIAEREKQNKVNYDNSLVSRIVSITTERNPIIRDMFLGKAINEKTAVTVRSEVVEPVEFIRNFELGSAYLSQFMESFKAERGQASQTQTDPNVYASRYSNVNGQQLYHFSGCRYIFQIKEENLIIFKSEKDAQNQGFHLCLFCAKNKKVQK